MIESGCLKIIELILLTTRMYVVDYICICVYLCVITIHYINYLIILLFFSSNFPIDIFLTKIRFD